MTIHNHGADGLCSITGQSMTFQQVP